MKPISGSFGTVVYSVHKHIRAEEIFFSVWTLHDRCSCTCFQGKDLFPLSDSHRYRFQNSQLKLVEDNQKFASHTSTSTTQSVSTMMQGMDKTCLLHTLLGAASKPAVCYCWHQQTFEGRSNPTLEVFHRDTSAVDFQAQISYLTKISRDAHVSHVLCNTFPFPPNTEWDFSYVATLKFFVCFIFAKPFVGI